MAEPMVFGHGGLGYVEFRFRGAKERRGLIYVDFSLYGGHEGLTMEVWSLWCSKEKREES